MLSSICLICCVLFLSQSVNAANAYDANSIKRMEDLINKTYRGYIAVLGTDTIDMINSPLYIKDQVIFGVFFLYNNYGSYNTLHETDHGHRL